MKLSETIKIFIKKMNIIFTEINAIINKNIIFCFKFVQNIYLKNFN